MKSNNQKGITLVALVITIIVLLILAGITIAALSGENGILVRARESKYASDISSAKELVILGINECITDYYADKYVSNTSSVGEKTIQEYIIENIQSTQASSVIASASDSTITNVIQTDLSKLISKTKIKKILVNGKTAQKYFSQYFSNINLPVFFLPSTSARNANFNLNKLTEEYKKALD